MKTRQNMTAQLSDVPLYALANASENESIGMSASFAVPSVSWSSTLAATPSIFSTSGKTFLRPAGKSEGFAHWKRSTLKLSVSFWSVVKSVCPPLKEIGSDDQNSFTIALR